ncbi:MAG: phosphoenolpyruvate synthase [Thermoproteota archaeon]
MKEENSYIQWFENLRNKDVPLVGGKNASLGEMIHTLKKEGVRVPEGFAITADAYWQFIEDNNLKEEIKENLEKWQKKENTLKETGKAIRQLFLKASFPQEIAEEIREAYKELCERYGTPEVDVAVRSSATAEDLPGASFAGQQETFLNIRGDKELLRACRECYASLFTNRVITYREEKGFEHMQVALSIGVQKMVRSDKAGAGVLFTIDTDTGFPDVVVIDASWGLGENVVQGKVNPDRYVVFKPPLENEEMKPIIEKALGKKEKKVVYAEGGKIKNIDTTDQERRSFVLKEEEILDLARWGSVIEEHYDMPMDIEWGKDGDSGKLFILQARPETVQSRKEAGSLKTYTLKERGEQLVTGVSIGAAIATGKVCRLLSAKEIDKFQEDFILVTEMTDPDWVPIMKKAAGIITDYGGRTSHAAIVSRELGIPAIVGTEDATHVLKTGQEVTMSCAEGEKGRVYEGILEFEESTVDLKDVPDTETQIMMNMASPGAAFRWWALPCKGIGLARMEFIINNIIKIHPMALVRFDELPDEKLRDQIRELTQGYDDKTEYFVEHLARGIAKIAASQYPDPVIVRMSDFKTHEYANLIGGDKFEPEEENPMLGFRGASRYYSDRYKPGFALECRAIKRVRQKMGMNNVVIMIPFCRTIEEAKKVTQVLEENGLKRGKNGLQVYVMAEIPSNVVLAEEFAEYFDGFSIGSNDLTQLMLGVDRDSAELSQLFDERDQAVKRTIHSLIQSAHKAHRKVSICGQAPSDYPEFVSFLVQAGIDSISVNPDSVIKVKRRVGETEQKLKERIN